METINKEFFHTKDAEVKKKKAKLPTLEAIIQGRTNVIKDKGTNKPSIPNNMIIYKAPTKLTETSSTKSTGSLNTQKFNTDVVSHTFENGVGTIEFEGDVTAIKNCAFAATNITEIQLPNTLVSIGMDTYNGYGAFTNCMGLTSITIPDNVTGIGQYAFSGCSNLTSMTIPNSVTSIGSSAFYGCSGLTSITIPNSITSIGSGAFGGCRSLTSVTIPNSVTNIGDKAFTDCSGLISVTIGNGVTSIGSGAFTHCPNLTSITLLATTPPTLTGSTQFFAYSNNCLVYVPSASLETYKTALGWRNDANRIQAIPTT